MQQTYQTITAHKRGTPVLGKSRPGDAESARQARRAETTCAKGQVARYASTSSVVEAPEAAGRPPLGGATMHQPHWSSSPSVVSAGSSTLRSCSGSHTRTLRGRAAPPPPPPLSRWAAAGSARARLRAGVSPSASVVEA
eukprot:scaffold123010_cov48-Phaeocystis_antarctica.AAC.1